MWFRRVRNRALDDLNAEIEDYLRRETQDNADRGMTPEEARYAARRKFGNVAAAQEEARAVWVVVWMEQLRQDVRYALRTLKRQPGFTAAVVATLALGIGMNAAVFSVFNSVLLKPLPYPNAERLIWLANYDQKWKHDNWVARHDYVLWKQQASSFAKMTAYGTQDLALVAGNEATQERIGSINGDFWSMTGASAAVGRLFGAGEVDSIVLSWSLFERRFRSDPQIVGSTVKLNGWTYRITGVLPRGYRCLFPQQTAPGDEAREIDAYTPIPDELMVMPPAGVQHWDTETRRSGPAPFWICVVGLLRPDVATDAARAEMETIYARIVRNDPGPLRVSRVLRFASLQEKLTGAARRPLVILLVAVSFVLLMGCANIAGLLLARASARQREIAIRTAVGAGRTRVIRQFLAESLVLAALGCGVGLLVGRWAIELFVRFAPHAAPRLGDASMDTRVLAFAVGLSLLAGLLFGLAPVMYAWRQHVADDLKMESGGASAGQGRTRARSFLVAAELAAALVLLTGAGLMMKSFWRMNARPAGFAPEKIVTMRVTLSGPEYRVWRSKQVYTEQMLAELLALPGVEWAGVDAGAMNTNVRVDGVGTVFAAVRGVSAGYLRVMGVPLLKGSWPEAGSLFGVVVNEAFARQLGGGDAAGRHIGGSFLNDTITGVVANFKSHQLDSEPLPEIYAPYERMPVSRSMRVAVRSAASLAALAPAVRKTMSNVDRTQPVYELQTLQEALAGSIAPRRFQLFLLSSFAATALLLAITGIYGVMTYAVSMRTREIGVRLALGARPGEILRMVLRQAMGLAVVGSLAGLVAALALTRWMIALLYEVSPSDPWTLGGVAVVLMATVIAGCAGPALRAARVDPLVALRYE